MGKIIFASLALLMLAAAPLQAQQQCTAEQQVALDTCISDATDGCSASSPGCKVRQVQLEDVVAILSNRCILRRNGRPKPAGSCRACLNAVIVDLRQGPTRALWPAFTSIVSAEVNRLRQNCGQAISGGSTSAGNKLCDRFPNLPKCTALSSSSLTSSSSSTSTSASSSSASSTSSSASS